jgi:hypothetical protein
MPPAKWKSVASRLAHAREHGGYNLVEREMDFNGDAARLQAPAEGELGALAFDYHKAH